MNGMPRFQEQPTRPQRIAVYDLDIIKIKFVVVFHTVLRQKTVSILKGSKPLRQSNIKNHQLGTLKALSKDPSVTILPAEGRAVVVMDSSDYQPKIYDLLQDESTYTKISDQRKNPTSSTEKSLNALLNKSKINNQSMIPAGAKQRDDKLYYKLRSTDATPVTFYGLPKIHKPEVPLRPITSSINCPTYQASKYLASILSPLQRNQFTVTNSNNYVRKTSNCTTESHEIMVSFDVVSLFTSIPMALALEVTKTRLESDSTIPERTNVSVDNIIRLNSYLKTTTLSLVPFPTNKYSAVP